MTGGLLPRHEVHTAGAGAALFWINTVYDLPHNSAIMIPKAS
ncbi:hypothetical protein FAES_0745 [Fibrella aestuarina BUZ 2]|uniref:Uncharacterized protein n=1 Tax=Fibrella aestuarina BUZ 2 TaxID=1166018 RepID=I0K3Q3_9BACT|nr:hypothetical protein FAES_0745 [Fibrella aestuarina BUZ 2]